MKRIKAAIVIGFCLIVIGAAAIVVEQISYTRREKVLDIGPLEATVAKEAHCFRLPVIHKPLQKLVLGNAKAVEIRRS